METRQYPASVVLFMDWDGTITARPGRKVIATDFFRSLFLAPPEGMQDSKDSLYNSGIFKGEEAKQIIEAEMYHQDEKRDERRPTLEAVNFLKAMTNLDNVFVFIVSANRRPYIETLLTLEGISSEKLGVFSLIDGFDGFTSDPRFKEEISSKNMMKESKEDALYLHLDALIKIAELEKRIDALKNYHFHLCDDVRDELDCMVSAISQYSHHLFPSHYNTHRNEPGNWNWNEIKEEIVNRLAAPPLIIDEAEKENEEATQNNHDSDVENHEAFSESESEEAETNNYSDKEYSDNEQNPDAPEVKLSSSGSSLFAKKYSDDEENEPTNGLKYSN